MGWCLSCCSTLHGLHSSFIKLWNITVCSLVKSTHPVSRSGLKGDAKKPKCLVLCMAYTLCMSLWRPLGLLLCPLLFHICIWFFLTLYHKPSFKCTLLAKNSFFYSSNMEVMQDFLVKPFALKCFLKHFQMLWCASVIGLSCDLHLRQASEKRACDSFESRSYSLISDGDFCHCILNLMNVVWECEPWLKTHVVIRSRSLDSIPN